MYILYDVPVQHFVTSRMETPAHAHIEIPNRIWYDVTRKTSLLTSANDASFREKLYPDSAHMLSPHSSTHHLLSAALPDRASQTRSASRRH